MEQQSLNQGLLRGKAAGGPRPSHLNHGTAYFSFHLEVERLSGATDTLNVILSQQTLEACPIIPGETYEAIGEVRSFNNHSGVGGRLIITFFAKSLIPTDGPHVNHLELNGALCKVPVLRRTPLGREICDLLLAVNRRYGRADYLPCIAWGALARVCGKLVNGVEEERVAYEVSILTME